MLVGRRPILKQICLEHIGLPLQQRYRCRYFTNGQSIVGKEKLIADYFPRIVGLSLYSGVAIEHDNITRVKGSWNKTISVIDSLAALSVPMVLKCCVMLPNVKSYNTVTNVAKQYGLYVQYELNVTDSIDGDKCVSHYLRLNPELLEIVLRDPYTAMYVGNEVTLWGGMDINMDENTCRAGYNTFCITPNGDLIPCCAFHLHFGNLKLHHLRDILTDNPILENGNILKCQITRNAERMNIARFALFVQE